MIKAVITHADIVFTCVVVIKVIVLEKQCTVQYNTVINIILGH